MTTASLTALVSVIVAPVALITPTAILLGNFMNKYTAIATQMRQLASEFRLSDCTPDRRKSITAQLHLFHRRIKAMWAASGSLLIALLAFLVTILSLVFIHRAVHITIVGAGSIIVGLGFICIAVVFEIYEIGLARLTTAGDLSDIMTDRVLLAQEKDHV